MQKFIAAYGNDIGYLNSLCNSLGKVEDFPYEMRCFTSKEGVMTLSPEEVLCVLTDEESPEIGEWNEDGKVRLIVLTDVSGYAAEGNHAMVYKYQDINGIASKIAAILEQEEEAPAKKGVLSREKYIGVVSPIGRVLKTSFCMTFGQLLARTERTLYVNLEAFPGFSALFEKEFSYGLSDLLYALETGGSRIRSEELLEHFHGLDILPPAVSAEDIFGADPTVIKKTVTELVTAGEYRTVLLDLSTDWALVETMLPICRKIYVPSRDDRLSAEKTAEFLRWIDRINDGELSSRVEVLVLPGYQSFTTGKNYLEQLLWSELGDFSRRLLERE